MAVPSRQTGQFSAYLSSWAVPHQLHNLSNWMEAERQPLPTELEAEAPKDLQQARVLVDITHQLCELVVAVHQTFAQASSALHGSKQQPLPPSANPQPPV